MRVASILGCVAIAAFAVWIGLAHAEETAVVSAAPLRLAILPTEPSPETKSLADLLPLELQKTGVEIVERAELDRVLQEQSLTAAGLAGGTAGRVAVGKLLRAEGFLFVGKTAAGERLSARLVETRYGYQVCQMLFPTNALNLDSLTSAIAETVQKKLPVLRLSDEKRILIGVLRIGNATLDPRAGWIEEEAPLLLSACLSAHPDVLTLERRELGALMEETLMTDSEKPQLRMADLIIDGDVFLASGESLAGQNSTLNMALRVRDKRQNELARFERKGKASELEQIIAGLAADLLTKISTLRPGASNLASIEPTLLLKMSGKRFIELDGGYRDLETAYALETTNLALRRSYIEGLIRYGDPVGLLPNNPLERAQQLAKAVNLILSSPDPSSMPKIIHHSFGGMLHASSLLKNPEISELLRPVRALARVELERELLSRTDRCPSLSQTYQFYCENEAEEILFSTRLIQQVANDSDSPQFDRRLRLAIMLLNMGAKPFWGDLPYKLSRPVSLPSALYDSLCTNDDPVIRFFAHVKVGNCTSSRSIRQAHYREALNLLDTLFEQTDFLKWQAAMRDKGYGSPDCVRVALENLHASGPSFGFEVERVLVNRFNGWIETNDLATLGDVLAFDYFPLLDQELARAMLEKVDQVRQRAAVRLPKTPHGIKTLERMADALNDQRQTRGEIAPYKPGDKLVLLSPHSANWQQIGGDIFCIDSIWARDPLSPQCLLVDGNTLWVTMRCKTPLDVFKGQKKDTWPGIPTFTVVTALLHMDLTTGRILSYRLTTRDNPGGLMMGFPLSSIFIWRDYICFGDKYAGLYLCPRECRSDDRTFEHVRRIDLKDGLPSLEITAATALGDTLYIGLPNLLLALPGGKGPPVVIANTVTETSGGPLAGAGSIMGLSADAAKGRLFIATSSRGSTNNLFGIWRYVPEDGSFVLLHKKTDLGHRYISNDPHVAFFQKHFLNKGEYFKVSNGFRFEDESLINSPTSGLPSESYLTRFDFASYQGGVITIGGQKKDWELAFFPGGLSNDMEAFAWAMEGTNNPANVSKSEEAERIKKTDGWNRQMDAAIIKIRKGETLTEKEQLAGREALSLYCDELYGKHGIKLTYRIPEPDRTLFYVAAVKTAFIDPEGNGGWPFRSDIRYRVLDQLKTMIAATNDPFLVFCSIFPALSRNDKEYAAKAYENLKEHDAFLARTTVKWSVENHTEPGWLVSYYMAKGEVGKAREIADLALATGFWNGMEIKAHLLAQLGEYSQAEALYKEIEIKHDYVTPLVGFYRKYPDQKDATGVFLAQRYEELVKRYFPSGMKKVELTELHARPVDGVEFTDDNRASKKSRRKMTIIRAVNGYRVENLAQFYFVRELDGPKPEMDLIVWDGDQYTEFKSDLASQLFGDDVRSYTKR